ncbi:MULTISPECIES: hypothetical protein [Bacillaceae]|uniref:Uncharacterized protein n=1 Tax=Peribacillus huizhouensis TaxID=1501239 RepID=A0ABR6CP76_9BACI|nr:MULTISPECIES: hypothetical protein [Bacillaceae]MBA9026815.1 hypothetical protein [Peribacillus huizhouensis]
MYSVQQLQALDYLLKRVITNGEFNFYRRDLKFVINYKDVLYTGDFLQMNGSSAYQSFIDDDGEVEQYRFSPDKGTKLLIDIWQSYLEEITRLFLNPFKRINDIPLLYNTLIKILNMAELDEESSPFYPYLLNVRTLDNTIQLPFLDLTGELVKIVSIVDCTVNKSA